jgi:hypothetical protein
VSYRGEISQLLFTKPVAKGINWNSRERVTLDIGSAIKNVMLAKSANYPAADSPR